MKKILILGYGNPGRLDDGLGPTAVAEVEKLNIAGVTCDSDYQLTVEDIVEINKHDVVIFIDADSKCDKAFYFNKITPGNSISFTSHSITPTSLLALCQEVYSSTPDAYILGIRGIEFNSFEERLSTIAQNNLNEALKFLTPILKQKIF